MEMQSEKNKENVMEPRETAAEESEKGSPEAAGGFTEGEFSYEEIEKGKQNYIAGGNTAENMQIFFNPVIYGGNSNGVFGIREDSTCFRGQAEKQKTYDLRKEEEMIRFVEEHGGDEYFVTAIVLCVFDYVLINDLPYLKNEMKKFLPSAADGQKNADVLFDGQYLSLDSILGVIGGRNFLLPDAKKCIGLGEGHKEALGCLFEQFPYLREQVARWLVSISASYPYRTSFDTAQIVNAFLNLVDLDFSWGVDRLLGRLYSDSKHSWLLGSVAIALYRRPHCRDPLLPLLYAWSRSEGWLWRPAFYAWAQLGSEEEDSTFTEYIKSSLQKRLLSFENDDISYLAALAARSPRIRSLVSETLHRSMRNASAEKQHILARIYVLCVKYSYYCVTERNTALAFVACDTKEQHLWLSPLIGTVLWNYSLKCAWLRIMNLYLREISHYETDEKTERRICVYFAYIMLEYPRYREDIRLFLIKCRNSMAELILKYCEEHDI